MATKINTAKAIKPKKKNNNRNYNKNQICLGKTIRDFGKIRYYNYNKKSHYSTNCSKFLKN